MRRIIISSVVLSFGMVFTDSLMAQGIIDDGLKVGIIYARAGGPEAENMFGEPMDPKSLLGYSFN